MQFGFWETRALRGSDHTERGATSSLKCDDGGSGSSEEVKEFINERSTRVMLVLLGRVIK